MFARSACPLLQQLLPPWELASVIIRIADVMLVAYIVYCKGEYTRSDYPSSRPVDLVATLDS